MHHSNTEEDAAAVVGGVVGMRLQSKMADKQCYVVGQEQKKSFAADSAVVAVVVVMGGRQAKLCF